MTILDEILEHKRDEVAAAKCERDSERLARSAQECERPLKGFESALRHADGISVIAEVKRQSPSKGLIREDFDPVAIARSYVAAGAACVSVLTDARYFGGSLEILEKIRAAVDCPILRKDFIVDRDQIAEARLAGADAILLIVAALSQEELAEFNEYAKSLGLDVLIEVHDEAELDRALDVGATLVGVNNRDLRTFDVDLATTERIARRLPSNSTVTLVSESGIGCASDIRRLEEAGAAAFLVGESLMRRPDPGEALTELRQESPTESGRETSP